MSTNTTMRDFELAPVKFSRLTRRGVLLGLSGLQLVVVGFGGITLIFALYVGGGASLMYVVPILLVCAGLAFVGVGGRKVVEWLPVVTRWLWRSTGGQLLFRRRIVQPRPVGTLALPGDAARLRQWFDPESGAVMVHDPHRSTLTAIDDWVRGGTAPERTAVQTGQPQFHCGDPPPAAEPSTRIHIRVPFCVFRERAPDPDLNPGPAPFR